MDKKKSKFLQALKQFVQSPAFIVAIVLVCVILTIHLIYRPTLEEYSSNINAELTGIIVTVIFVQFIFDRKKHGHERIKEYQQVLRDDDIMEIYLKRYKICFNAMLTPTGIQRDFVDSFEYKDLANIYRISKSAHKGMSRSAVESFYDSQKELAYFMQTLLKNNTYEYHHPLREILTKFVASRLALDVSKTILKKQDAEMNTEDEQMLAKSTKEDYETYKDKLANPHSIYICLYDLLQIEQDLIIKYEKEMERIRKKKNSPAKRYFAMNACKFFVSEKSQLTMKEN